MRAPEGSECLYYVAKSFNPVWEFNLGAYVEHSFFTNKSWLVHWLDGFCSCNAPCGRLNTVTSEGVLLQFNNYTAEQPFSFFGTLLQLDAVRRWQSFPPNTTTKLFAQICAHRKLSHTRMRRCSVCLNDSLQFACCVGGWVGQSTVFQPVSSICA